VLGGKALAVATDVIHCDQVKRLVDTAVQTYGRIDVMINNAGPMPQSPLERLKIEEWDRTIDVNIKGVLYGIAAALPHMKQQKAGHIINVSSVAGHKIGPGFAVYAATKHAVRALSEGLRLEVKPYNIRTTVISPGAVATELPNSVAEPDVAQRIQKFYKEIAIPAESFARAVAFAMSQPEEVDVNEEAVSVAIEEIKPQDWAEKVYKPENPEQPGEAVQETRIHDVKDDEKGAFREIPHAHGPGAEHEETALGPPRWRCLRRTTSQW
jgi:NADP-dependent 3-hydroxy acid dehydrogenase YdfG